MGGTATTDKLATLRAYFDSRGLKPGTQIPRDIFDGIVMAGFGLGIQAGRNLTQSGHALKKWEMGGRIHSAGRMGSKPGLVTLL